MRIGRVRSRGSHQDSKQCEKSNYIIPEGGDTQMNRAAIFGLHLAEIMGRSMRVALAEKCSASDFHHGRVGSEKLIDSSSPNSRTLVGPTNSKDTM